MSSWHGASLISQRPLESHSLFPLFPSEPPEVKPVRSIPPHGLPASEMSSLEQELVQQLLSHAAVPPLPQVAQTALAMANEPGAGIEQLVQRMNSDLPLTARFMSAADSVAFFRESVRCSARGTIVALGLANTRDLLFQSVCLASISGSGKFQPAVTRSFKRSVFAAAAARTAAAELEIESEHAYLIGLLHDLGEARVYRILDAIRTSSADAALVRWLVHKYHAFAGAEIVEAWKLPPEIAEACAEHHDDGAAGKPHVRLAMIADVIVSSLEARAVEKVTPTAAAEGLGLTDAVVCSLVERTRAFVGSRVSRRP